METTKELKTEIEKSLGLLQTLRDELRVKLHLAGMDVKDEWNKLEPKLEEIEKSAENASEASLRSVTEAIKKLEKLLGSL